MLIFRYGVKSLILRGSQVHVSLTYTPKTESLSKKFGNLPIDYIRLGLDTPHELDLFEEAMRKFCFNARCDFEGVEDEPSPKKVKYVTDQNEPCNTTPAEVEHGKKKNKLRLLENRVLKPASSTAIYEVYDNDAHEHNAQKFTYQTL